MTERAGREFHDEYEAQLNYFRERRRIAIVFASVHFILALTGLLPALFTFTVVSPLGAAAWGLNFVVLALRRAELRSLSVEVARYQLLDERG